MKNGIRILVVAAIVALVFAALPATTSNVAIAQAGGGVIIEATFGSGPQDLSPILCNDTACARLVNFMFPTLVGIDPQSTAFVPNAGYALAKEWTVSEDGKVYTFKLRDDLKWSDGTPITTKDVMYYWSIVKAPESPSPASFLTGIIESVEAPDDYTVVITYKDAACTALNNAAVIQPAPAHLLQDVAATDLKNNDFNINPSVSAGVFKFQEYRSGERTTLVKNEANPWETTMPDGFIYNVVPDQTVLVERFLAGELNVIDGAAVNRRADIKAAGERGEAKVFDFPGNSWDYLAMNIADPANPKSALDADGKLVDQGKHPILGDKMVRRAIALAIDVDSIIKGAVFGEGARMASFLIPTSWAHDPALQPLPYDPEESKKILDELGWKVGADGIREKDGIKMQLTLITNQGNTRREAIGTIVKDALAQIGIEVDFQTIDFNVLIDRMYAETFDMLILGWRNGFPDDPDATQLFTTAGDVIGSASNFTSWYNERFEELNKQALALPGCAQEERAKLYQEMEKIFQDELPYVPMFVINGQYAARSNVEGFDPLPNQMYWNVASWTVKTQ